MEDVQRTEALLLAVRFLTGGAANFAIALSKAALPAAATQLAQHAREIADSADDSELDSSGLRAAADRLSQADFASRPRAISDLVLQCSRLDGLAAAGDAAAFSDIRRRILEAEMAGRTLLRVIPARQLDFLLEAEMAQERDECSDRDAARGRADAAAREEVDAEAARANGWWWRRLASRLSSARETGWWRRLASRFSKKSETGGGGGLPEADLEAVPLIAPHSRPDPSTSNTPSQDWLPPLGNWLTTQTFALAASMCLLPYMSPAGILSDEADFNDDYRWRVQFVFQTWWCLVAMGVPCTLCGRSWIEQHYARISAHLGMLGITVNVLFFCHWMLAAIATNVMKVFLGGATAYFLMYWIRCCWVREI
ncbi:uncharacterized protein LOC123402214 isoform X1 [Hordeum vulgare subsp. vulgare]|uniref:Predicted protein n=1 Tax=Hordeum vulgare subsp. vulgare TaxID=112509 RepID=F2D076_HORVV|nr:uncharacterized protein LOC123402214 isoform X1 [Hordeum vulgare subsp. vulgare]BAJ88497.1 predicted protein [Hordeum vulgare subsp. vulgare]